VGLFFVQKLPVDEPSIGEGLPARCDAIPLFMRLPVAGSVSRKAASLRSVERRATLNDSYVATRVSAAPKR
jgi:hypothetical protein